MPRATHDTGRVPRAPAVPGAPAASAGELLPQQGEGPGGTPYRPAAGIAPAGLPSALPPGELTPGAVLPAEGDSTITLALVQRAQVGDADAFGELYDRYVDLIYRYIYYRVGTSQIA